jgi:hypothetical protein
MAHAGTVGGVAYRTPIRRPRQPAELEFDPLRRLLAERAVPVAELQRAIKEMPQVSENEPSATPGGQSSDSDAAAG